MGSQDRRSRSAWIELSNEKSRPAIGAGRLFFKCDPNGVRTRVAAVKGRSPRPLDDGAFDLADTDDSQLGLKSAWIVIGNFLPKLARKREHY